MLNKLLFWRKKPAPPPPLSLRTAVDKCDKLLQELELLSFMLQQLGHELNDNLIFKQQIADFYTKSDFAVGSLLCTLRLAVEDNERKAFLKEFNKRMESQKEPK